MKTAVFWKSFAEAQPLVEDSRAMVAFLGRSNVGKSTLVNVLTGQKGLAHVSANPGRTATINAYIIDGYKLLLDLPGYGFAKTSKTQREQFQRLISDFLETANHACVRAILILVDGRIGLTRLDFEMFETVERVGLPYAIVMTKMDGLSNNQRHVAIQQVERDTHGNIPLFPCSATTGAGLDDIRKFLEEKWR